MTEDIKIYDDVLQRTLNLLLGQFREKENWEKFIKVIIEPLQELEYVYEDLLLEVSLDTSEGAQLDQLGQIIGALRGSLNDEDYRELLKFVAALNKSAGEPEFLISALKQLTSATIVQLIEVFPAALFLYTNGTIIPDNLRQKMDDLALGGVAVLYIIVGTDPSFVFDGSPEKGFGYGWINGTGTLVTDNAGQYSWAIL